MSRARNGTRPAETAVEATGKNHALRTAVCVAVVTMAAAALLLGAGGWGPVLCTPFHAGYPLCAL